MSFQFKVLLSALFLILLHADHGAGLFSYLGIGWLSEGYHAVMRPVYHSMSPLLFVTIFSIAIAVVMSVRFVRAPKA